MFIAHVDHPGTLVSILIWIRAHVIWYKMKFPQGVVGDLDELYECAAVASGQLADALKDSAPTGYTFKSIQK
jgi:hypothetical protein